MLLIYRGHTFQASVRSPKPYRKPIALNWRYRTSDECCDDEISLRPMRPISKTPRAINWRWRVQS